MYRKHTYRLRRVARREDYKNRCDIHRLTRSTGDRGYCALLQTSAELSHRMVISPANPA
jgi:hypothetical protein